MTDVPPLDYAEILPRVAAMKREFDSILAGEAETVDLTPIAVDPSLLPLEFVPAGTVIDRIRTDCELIAAWENAGAGFDDRERILTFVMERRGVAERPAWGDGWVSGEE